MRVITTILLATTSLVYSLDLSETTSVMLHPSSSSSVMDVGSPTLYPEFSPVQAAAPRYRTVATNTDKVPETKSDPENAKLMVVMCKIAMQALDAVTAHAESKKVVVPPVAIPAVQELQTMLDQFPTETMVVDTDSDPEKVLEPRPTREIREKK